MWRNKCLYVNNTVQEIYQVWMRNDLRYKIPNPCFSAQSY